MNLDNGKSQAVTDAPLMEEESAMARQKFSVTLPSGEKVWASGETISEAFCSFADRYGSSQQAPTVKADAPTLKNFVDQTYRRAFMEPLAPKTKGNYENYLKYNILPFMGEMPMDDVSVATVQEFVNWMATGTERGRRKDLNERSIERICGFASRIFKIAVELELIEKNPFKKDLIRINAEPAGHHEALSDAEIARVKREIPLLESRDERLCMALVAYTGMRREEILGMHWEDISLDDQFCSVRWTVTFPDNSKACLRNTAKTPAGVRDIPLPLPLVDILRPQAEEKGFVLGGEEPFCYSRFQRVFNRARKKLKIEDFNSHDYRTTYGTQLKEMGVTSAACADLLGHADTRMVETIYARRRHEGVMKQLDIIERLNEGIN